MDNLRERECTTDVDTSQESTDSISLDTSIEHSLEELENVEITDSLSLDASQVTPEQAADDRDLTRKVGNCMLKVKALKHRIKQLENEMTAELKKHEKAKKDHEAEVKRYKDRYDSISNANASLNVKVQNCSKTEEEVNKKIVDLQSEFDCMKIDFTAVEDKVRLKDGEIQRLKDSLKEKERKICELENTLSETTKEKDDRVHEVYILKNNLELLEKPAVIVENMCTQTEAVNNEQVDTREEMVSKLKEAIDVYEEKEKEHEAEVQSYQNALHTMLEFDKSATNFSYYTEFQDVMVENRDLNAKVKDLEKKIAALKMNLSEEIAKNKQNQKAKSAEIKNLRESLEKKTKLCSALLEKNRQYDKSILSAERILHTEFNEGGEVVADEPPDTPIVELPSAPESHEQDAPTTSNDNRKRKQPDDDQELDRPSKK